ncbi:MAG: 23S rRNA (guanosine(2251)-2'-O)-methyltransferase RlmB [Bacillota bacterium]|nr:23S rRNA (guanosine(2251)-2'-O)-methyltransferase RlmB [Candidatus Fermentithermobacillaceae bacterium]
MRRSRESDYIQIHGRQPVNEALLNGWPIREVVVRKGPRDAILTEMVSKASALGVRTTVMEAPAFDRRFSRDTQGVVAIVKEVQTQNLDDLRRDIPRGQDPLFVALDGIEDPHNLGAITRTCLAMGVHAVVIPKHRTASLGEGAAKSSAGAIFRQPICQVSNIHYFIEWAKRQGLWVYGLDASATEDIWNTDLSGPVALIIGGEDKGLARLTREKCDFLVKIPMTGRIGSLNASVACGMAISECQRQRQQKPSDRP